MPSGFPLPGIIVNPGFPATSVNITSRSGTAASIFSDRYGVSPVSLPVVISAPTTYYVAGEGPWTVNGQTVGLEGTEVATVNLPRPTGARLGGTTNRAAAVPYYNVQDFGALGDGVTDDTTAINATLAAAASVPGWVIFPKGTFLVNTIGQVSGATAAFLCPPSTIHGLRIIGAGIGQTIIKTTTTQYGYILQNFGNDSGWIVEGLDIQGPGSGSTTVQMSLGGGGQLQGSFGPGMWGIFGNFLVSAQMRNCHISGCNGGVIDQAGNGNAWDVHAELNRNAGIALVRTVGAVVRGVYQTQNNGGNAANTEVVANILVCNFSASDGGSQSCRIEPTFIDELGSLNSNGGGACLHIVSGSDIDVRTGQIYAPGKKQVSGAAFYGIRIGPQANRVKIEGARVMPYTVDTFRVPDHTILIEAGATDTVLQDISTNPNAANGGGDLLDSGTRTVYRNVSLNDGPRFSSVATKAGVPVDGDYQVAPPVGTQVLDTTDGKIYYRTASATWKAATLT